MKTETALQAAAFLAASLVAPTNAHAYIDPVSGSVLLQALVAGALATAFTLKVYWRKFTASVQRGWSRFSNRQE